MKKLLLVLCVCAGLCNSAWSQCAPNCSAYVGTSITYTMLPVTGHNSVTLSDDELSSPINIGFNFDFFCNTQTQFLISSNGWITFDLGQTDAAPGAYYLPDPSGPTNVIAFYWMDFDPGLGGSITYTTIGTAPNRQCVITYTDINLYADPGYLNSGQIILYETSNMIDIYTAYITNDGSEGTQGIEDGSGSIGFEIPGSNLNYLTLNNTAYRFSLPGSPTAPTLISGNATGICEGAAQSYSVDLLPGATYDWILPSGWSGTSTTNIITPVAGASGTIMVTANYTACGASSAINLPVVITPAPIVALSSSAPIICSGDAETITPTGGISYTLQPGNHVGTSSFLVYPNVNTTYTLYGTDASNCVSFNDPTSMITVNQSPTITVNSGVTCAGQLFMLQPNGATTYSYSNGIPSVVQTVAGVYTYSVTGVGGNGCPSAPAVSTITVVANPTITVTANRATICNGEEAVITAHGGDTYSWMSGPASDSYTVNPIASTIYVVTGTSTNGNCSRTASITVNVSDCTGLTEQSKAGANKISVFPNPSNGEYTVNAMEDATLEVYDIQGRLIAKQAVEKGSSLLNMNQQASGQYLLRAVSDTNVQSVILIKQ